MTLSIVDRAASYAHRDPSEAQKESGNYRKGHVKFQGLEITIENARGSMRRGTGADGKPWSVKLPAHYGYIKRTEGADGDHIDVYIGPHHKSPHVFVVDQVDADSGEYDEHKVMLGFGSKKQAENVYRAGFSDGRGGDRIGHIAEMTIAQFKDWLKGEDTTEPIRGKYARGGVVKKIAENKKRNKGHSWDARSRGPWDRRAHKASGGAVDDWVSPPADDWVTPASPPKASPALSDAVTDIPREIGHAASENWDAIKKAFVPGGQGLQGSLERLANTGKGLLAIPGLVASPLTGAARSLIGHPLAQAEHAAGTIIAPEIAAKDDPAAMYERAKGDVDTAMSAMAPKGGLKPVPAVGPAPALPADPLGVTLSEGQKTGELPAIRTEQAALRGQIGTEAESRAKAFADQQARQLEGARGDVVKSLDPGAQVIAETPLDAGELAARIVQQEAGRAKQGVTAAYDKAKAQPGEIHADAFREMGDNIKTDITNRSDPIIIDDKLTPMASHMIRDIDDRVAKLQIQNRAQTPSRALSPAGDDSQIVGVNLQGVEQIRKRLSAFRKDAFASGNATDGRAAQAVLDAFDGRIDHAVNNGMFNGDPAAVRAWNAARAAHSDYMSTFGKGKNDPVGRVIEKILGSKNNPAAIPNDVADFMYGASGTNPSSLHVGVANRVKKIMGADSPEWAGVRQGLFERVIGDFGHDRAVKNLDKLLNADGKELAEAVFTPAQRQLLQQYADLRQKLQIPATGVNRSETSTFVAPMMKKLSAGVAAVIGAMLGHALAPGAFGVGELIGAGIIGKGSGLVTDAAKARKVSNQMPLVADRMKQWQRAVVNHARGGAPSQTGVAVASTNLAKSLGNIGFDYGNTLRFLQGAVPARAQDENQKP